MYIFLAANMDPKLKKLLVSLRYPHLYSFLNEPKECERFPLELPLMVDSGAFSWNREKRKLGKRQTPLPKIFSFYFDYLKFIARRVSFESEQKLYNTFYVELDVYHHASRDDLEPYAQRGKSIAGQRFVRVYHPIIDGGTLEVLDEWIRQGHTYVGVSHEGMYLLDQIFSRTRTKVRVHGFAMTKPDLLERYPFFSVDSTSWMSVQKFGGTFLHRQGKRISKEQQVKVRHHTFFKDSRLCMIDGAYYYMKMQDYFTNLWIKRGVTWTNPL